MPGRALEVRFGFAPANIVVLAEAALEREDFVDAISSAEAIRSRFATLAGRVTAQDEVYVILFGHGSFDGQTAQLNIPRRDLTDADYAELLASLAAERVVFVNTASASAPFIRHVAAPGRIVITATRRGTERNETVFPRFFVEALADPASDLDRDGNVSILEIFRYASARTAQSFEDGGHLATERALLDDTGSGTGATEADLERRGAGRPGVRYPLEQASAGAGIRRHRVGVSRAGGHRARHRLAQGPQADAWGAGLLPRPRSAARTPRAPERPDRKRRERPQWVRA
jgi:hypothetical protein